MIYINILGNEFFLRVQGHLMGVGAGKKHV